MPANDAAKMLSAGRGQTTRAVAAVPDVVETPAEAPVAEATRRPVAQYEKTGAFITPEQKLWLNEVTARAKLDGVEGISASDVIRLALAKLEGEVAGGMDLVADLIDQAHNEAERFPGRKNRGLPARR